MITKLIEYIKQDIVQKGAVTNGVPVVCLSGIGGNMSKKENLSSNKKSTGMDLGGWIEFYSEIERNRNK